MRYSKPPELVQKTPPKLPSPPLQILWKITSAITRLIQLESPIEISIHHPYIFTFFLVLFNIRSEVCAKIIKAPPLTSLIEVLVRLRQLHSGGQAPGDLPQQR